MACSSCSRARSTDDMRERSADRSLSSTLCSCGHSPGGSPSATWRARSVMMPIGRATPVAHTGASSRPSTSEPTSAAMPRSRVEAMRGFSMPLGVRTRKNQSSCFEWAIVASNSWPSSRRVPTGRSTSRARRKISSPTRLRVPTRAGLSLSASTSPRRSRTDTLSMPRPLAVHRVLRM